MTRFINKFILTVLCLSFAAFAFAAGQAASQKEVLQNFAAWDHKLESLKIDFSQTTGFEGTEISSSRGRLYKSGNKIRLDTLENGKVVQSAVTDKKIIRVFDGKGKAVTSLSWQEWLEGQPNKALFDFGNYEKVLKTHKVKSFESTAKGYKVTFEPADASDGGYLLEFALSKDCFPSAISVSNQGVKTETVLKDINKNVKLDKGLFK